MKLILLAAGYATRLYPLTQTTPKPLLPVGGRPMLERVLDAAPLAEISHAYVVTNAGFAPQFEAWAAGARCPVPLTIANDGTTSNENRLGAIGDLQWVLNQHHVDDDVLVVAGDNLFTESFGGFAAFARARQAPCLGVYDVGSLEAASQYGVVAVDAAGRLTSFEEKPAQPRSTLIGIALYYYPHAVLPQIHRYLAEGNNPDQPGRLIQWLYPQMPVHTWQVRGRWLDIGSHETLAQAQALFAAAT